MRYKCLAELLLTATLLSPIGCDLHCDKKPEKRDYTAPHASSQQETVQQHAVQQAQQPTKPNVPKDLEGLLINDPEIKIEKFYSPEELSQLASSDIVKEMYMIEYKPCKNPDDFVIYEIILTKKGIDEMVAEIGEKEASERIKKMLGIGGKIFEITEKEHKELIHGRKEKVLMTNPITEVGEILVEQFVGATGIVEMDASTSDAGIFYRGYITSGTFEEMKSTNIGAPYLRYDKEESKPVVDAAKRFFDVMFRVKSSLLNTTKYERARDNVYRYASENFDFQVNPKLKEIFGIERFDK